MFTDTVLNPTQKKITFKALKNITKETIHPFLISAALDNHLFPTPMETEQLASLKTAYKACGSLAGVGGLIEQSILEYFKICGYEQFDNLVTTTFTDEHWNSSFLIHLINALDINIQNDPLVILTIEDGKVYWKYVCGDRLLHDRTARKDPANAFNFNDAKTISMTWEQFRTFKDAGKRGGSVAITKDRFTLQFARTQHTVAEAIWNDLKTIGILDHNDRPSQAWRCYSGDIPLPYIESRIISKSSAKEKKEERANYQLTISALKSISEDKQYAEMISARHGATLFRPDRSPKNWALTGRVTNNEPKSKPHQVKPWDISCYSDLNSHAEANDDLDHDHIPSTHFLQKMKLALMAKGSDLETINNEDKNSWGCIAISHALHKQGVSHSESSANQEKQINKPFVDEVCDYLDKLEMN